MSRLTECLPLVPQSAQEPHIFPPGSRCLNCLYKEKTENPNFVVCDFLGKVNADWGCPLYLRQSPDSAI